MKKNLDHLLDIKNEDEQEMQLKAALGQVFNDTLKKEFAQELKEKYNLEKGSENNLKPEGKVVVFRKNRMKWLAAASLIGFTFLFYSIFYLRPINTLDQYATSDIIRHTGLLKGNASTGLMGPAITAFNDEKWAQAYDLFSKIDDKTEEVYYYTAMAAFYNKNYTNAIENFNSVNKTNSDYAQEVNWFKGLSYMLNNQYDKGREVLKSIKPDEWKYKEALKILEM